MLQESESHTLVAGLFLQMKVDAHWHPLHCQQYAPLQKQEMTPNPQPHYAIRSHPDSSPKSDRLEQSYLVDRKCSPCGLQDELLHYFGDTPLPDQCARQTGRSQQRHSHSFEIASWSACLHSFRGTRKGFS